MQKSENEYQKILKKEQKEEAKKERASCRYDSWLNVEKVFR